MTPLRDLHLGRLGLPTITDTITEQLGSEIQNVGESSAVGQRRAKGFTLDFAVHGFNDSDPTAAGNSMRRRLRSLIQNHPLRLASLYMNFAADTERNGWLIVGDAQLADDDGGVTFGSYKLTLTQAFLIASRRSHREGYRCDLTDLRLSTSPADYLASQIGAAQGFASQATLPLIFLPPGATDANVLDSPAAAGSRSSIDGAVPVCAGRSNGDVIVWERPEASFNLGDVVAYDRRGNLGPFGTGGAYDSTAGLADPQTAYGWEEFYGPDYPYSWLTAGQPLDVPVLSNGVSRVRYDSSNTPGFRIDVWNGATWAEQSKVTFVRNDSSSAGAGIHALDTLVSAQLVEYTTDRAVVLAIMRASGDPLSRERVYITLQRGWTGPRFELYTAAGTDGTVAAVGGQILLWAQPGDANDSIVCVDSTGAQILATAGSGSALLSMPERNVGGATFNRENWLCMLREGQPYAPVSAVLQPGARKTGGSGTGGYGTNANYSSVQVTTGGYLSRHIGFHATVADQVLEAEAIINPSDATAGVITDALASGGHAVRDTQTTASALTLVKSSSSIIAQAKYRALARVKTDGGAVGKYQCVLGGTAGPTVTFSPSAWTWVDLGDIVAGGSGQAALYAFGGSAAGSIAAPTGLGTAPSVLGGGLSAGTYYYKVTALKGSGETTGSTEVSAVVPGTLSAPASPVATPSDTGGGLVNGSYFYVVTAVNANGETVGSAEVSATLSATLAAPTGLAATASNGGGAFSGGTYFYKVTALNAAGETVGSSEVNGVVSALLPAPTGVQAALAASAGALSGGTYFYKVTALNAAGETVGSSEVSRTIAALSAPSGVSATAANGGTLAAGTTYFYKITAVNATGETTGSSEVSLAAAAAISAPTGVGATASSSGGSMASGTQFFYVVTAVNAEGETVGSAEVSATTPAGGGTESFVATAQSGTEGASPQSCGKPTGVAQNDVMIAQVTFPTSSVASAAITAPSGWALIGGNGGGTPSVWWYWKTAGASEPSSYSFSWTGGASGTVTIGAWRNVQAPEVSGATVSTGSTSPITDAAITPTAAGEAVLFLAGFGSGAAPTVTAPASYTTRQAVSDRCYIADRLNAPGGSTGTVTAAQGNQKAYVSLLISLPALPSNTSSVALTWSPVTGATGYKIYRATSTGGETTSPALVGTVGATTSFTDTAASPSAGSAPTTNTTAINAAALSWAAVSGATGYKIYRATTAGGETGATSLLTTISGGTSTAYTDTGSATTTGAIPGSNTTGGAGAIALTWNPVAGASGYKVYRASSAGGETGANSLVATISGGGSNGWTDTGATAFAGSVPGSNTATVTTGSIALAWNVVSGASSYNIYRAGAAGGETGASSLVANVVTNAYTDPGNATTTGSVPGSNTAALNTGKVALTWSAVTGAASYNVYRAPVTGGETSGSTLLASGVTAAAYTDTGAVTPSGSHAPTSNTATVTTGSVGVSWAAVTGATGYNIYRASTPGGEGTSPALVGSVGATTSFTDTAATPSTGSVPGSNTTGGAGVYIDRLELIKVEDRVRPGAPYGGARDHGQSCLVDARVEARRVARG